MTKAIHVSRRGNNLIARTLFNLFWMYKILQPWEIADMIANESGGEWQPTVKQVRSALYRLRDNGYIEKNPGPAKAYWRRTSECPRKYGNAPNSLKYRIDQ